MYYLLLFTLEWLLGFTWIWKKCTRVWRLGFQYSKYKKAPRKECRLTSASYPSKKLQNLLEKWQTPYFIWPLIVLFIYKSDDWTVSSPPSSQLILMLLWWDRSRLCIFSSSLIKRFMSFATIWHIWYRTDDRTTFRKDVEHVHET